MVAESLMLCYGKNSGPKAACARRLWATRPVARGGPEGHPRYLGTKRALQQGRSLGVVFRFAETVFYWNMIGNSDDYLP